MAHNKDMTNHTATARKITQRQARNLKPGSRIKVAGMGCWTAEIIDASTDEGYTTIHFANGWTSKWKATQRFQVKEPV